MRFRLSDYLWSHKVRNIVVNGWVRFGLPASSGMRSSGGCTELGINRGLSLRRRFCQESKASRYKWHYPLIAMAVVFASGCTSYSDIRGSDNSVQAPLLRASILLGDHGPRATRVQVDMAYYKGGFEHGVGADDTAAINDRDFDGPTTLDVEAAITVGHVAVAVPFPVREGAPSRVEARLGVAVVDSRIKVSDPTGSDILEDNRPGVSYGLALVLATDDERLGVRAALSEITGLSMGASEMEVLGFYAPTRKLELLLGYRQLGYGLQQMNTASDIHIEFSGPTAGLSFMF